MTSATANPIPELLADALQHHRAGQLQRAEAIYRQILEIDSCHAEALHYLGLVAHQTGKHEEAVDYFQRSLALAPQIAVFHSNLGLAYQALGRLDQATACYQEALRLQPDYFDAHNNLANALAEQGKLDEAVASYRRALALNPNHAVPHYNLASTLAKQGQLEEATASFQQALRLKPDHAKAHLNLGHVMLEQSKIEQALVHYRQALKFQPDMAEAQAALASVLSEQGYTEDAVTALQAALRLQPSARHQIALATRLPIIYQSVAEVERWRENMVGGVRKLRERQVVHDLTDQPGLNLFYLAYQGLDDREIMRDIAQLYRAPSFDIRHRRPDAGRIRIGFISSFFRKHTIGYLMAGLIAKLSREAFEVTVLSVGHSEDAVADFIKKSSDRFVEVPRHLPSARKLIAEQQLDVLFYTDIGMDPVTSALAFSRLAPVQCTTWGHPMTTGIDTIDYFISSEALETEGAEQHYTEHLITLQNLPIYYYRPELASPRKERKDFGLTNESHVYACPQSLFKLHPEFDEVVGGILRRDSKGTVVLLQGAVPHWEELLRQRFAAALPDVQDRIRFLPKLSRPDFLNLMAVSEVLLDPLHFGGGNTSYEGLAFGTPIVTLPSQFLRGRITFALYQQIGILDCVAHNPTEYIEIALRLGTDPGYRQTIRAKLLAAHNLLFENSQGIRQLEEFLVGSVRQKAGAVTSDA